MVASDAEMLATCGGHMKRPREQLSEVVLMHWLSWQSEEEKYENSSKLALDGGL